MKSNFFKYIFIIFVVGILIFAIVKIKTDEEQKQNGVQETRKQEEKITELHLGIAEFDTINPLLTKNKNVQDITKLIYEPLVNINENIIKIAGDKPGTTFSMAITRNKNDKDMVTSVSTGDSRILKISPNGKVKQLSKDDNLFEEGLKAGSLYTIDSDPNRVYTSQLQYSSEDVIYRRRDKTKGIHILNDSDIRFYNKNNVITGFLGCGQASDTLQKELDQNTENFITEDYLNSGDKLFLCSDGISDNFSNSEIANLMYTSRNSRECLKNMINAIYEIENKKQLEKTNNPPEYIKRNRNFKDVLKGAEDNISAIIMAQNQNSKEKDNESER